MTVEVVRSSIVAAPADRVWAGISNLHGVNRELRPFVAMREPPAFRGRTLASFAPGERLHCLMLAGGVVPFDRHHLGLESLTPGEGFVEESTSWMQRRWRHERTIESVDGGTRVTDRVLAEPRLGLLAPVVQRVVGALFSHRHRRLAEIFADLAPVHRPRADRTDEARLVPMAERDLSFIDVAPLRVEVSHEAEALPGQVWAVLADHRRWVEWFGPSLVSCEPVSPEESGVGARRLIRLRGGATIAERFIAWDEPELWAFTGTGNRPAVFEELVERVQLTPVGGGRTRITYTLAATPARAIRWALPALRMGMTRSLAGSLRGLANRAVEAEGASGAHVPDEPDEPVLPDDPVVSDVPIASDVSDVSGGSGPPEPRSGAT